MKLTKAMPQAAPFKCTLYGNPGTGKTTFALMCAEGLAKRRGGRIAVYDTEFGTKYLAADSPARTCHPKAFDFDRLVTRSIKDITESVNSLNPKEHTCVVVDSWSHVWEAAREAWEARNPNKEIALRDWGPLKKPYKTLLKFLLDSPFDVILVGRQKTLFEEHDGKLSNVGVGMRADSEVQFEPDFCFQMTSIGQRGEETIPSLFVEKDRSSILHGRTFTKPTFATIEPILSVLGTASLKMDEDDDERAEKDSELLNEAEDKQRAKAEKSAGILADMGAKLHAAQSVADLGAVAAEVKKLKRHMTEEHTNALRVIFESRRDALVQQTAGGI